MSIIIGLHMGHDASISVLRDGIPVFCLSEERLTREKMYYGFPFLALECALNNSSISPDQVDILALDTHELPGLLGPDEISRRFKRGKTKELLKHFIKVKKVLSYILGPKKTEDQLKKEREAQAILRENLKKYGFDPHRIRTYDHHQCHVASAFWPSPFGKALYLSVDGRGDGLSATLGMASGESLQRKIAISDRDSIGQFYAAVTFFLGFRPNRHEGKITGLAAHGDPSLLGPTFLDNVTWNADGSYRFEIPPKYRLASEADLQAFLRRMPLSQKDRIIIHASSGLDTLLYTTNWYSLLAYLEDVATGVSREDLAAGVQYFVEKVCTEFVQRHLPPDPIPIVLAGGVFSNVRVNQKIRELPGITNIFIQPAMGDDGLSLGAALLGYADLNQDARNSLDANSRPCQVGHTYLGPQYSQEEILTASAAEGIELKAFNNIEEEIARWIHEGKIVGFFHGRLEFGPRALGHRSILAAATDAGINQILNQRLDRTEFMPFAPSILAEYASQYLEGYQDDHVASEYMTITYQIPLSKRDEIQAVVHVDGTARPQVVHAYREPTYHKIIEEYYKISGIPVIINTSYNVHEEPIVCTPRDAIKSFKSNCVDILVMENYAAFNL
jgi:carbamoyltransferase